MRPVYKWGGAAVIATLISGFTLLNVARPWVEAYATPKTSEKVVALGNRHDKDVRDLREEMRQQITDNNEKLVKLIVTAIATATP